MSLPSVLITRRLPSSSLKSLDGLAHVEMVQGDGAMPPDTLRAAIADKDGLVSVLTDVVDRETLDAGASLRVVANVAVGFNNIDVRYARQRGIVVTNTPDVLTDAVADFTWALTLAVTRRIPEGERLLRRGEWKGWALDFLLGSELRGKQLGIVGFGRIGRAVAARASAFGMTVACRSRSAAHIAGVRSMAFDELLATSDVVSVHVPMTPETHHMIDQRALARMRRSAYLVNTSRGSIVDEAALVWALTNRLISGAALDVYEHEPTVHPGLLGLENVVLAPHLGSATMETRTAMADLAVRNVAAVLQGHGPLTPVQDSGRP